ncbi:EamA family transporter RarD [Desulforamulus hydrothermalis]|uniref:Putative chloramphenicol resistance permease n=1 Tax=Desulforamulus hydrothermalis Lam5 = DSM 18033 TaxID=1121428 RepID=K8DZ50_9FIRM|nr:EamA family transporter RarD [Desulforamulus hydrothermalis]CCO08175.1 putative chloramphenicol resistance permease [Desulforamulus hydrothermalis Lam5 = DSM 18033]SHH23170.1 chloramphenicol-sensitive protein RarD [Desulforamulus hydrothermalis Lam5 = DSM 18033]
MKKIQPAKNRQGIAFALGAYLLWGILPAYWKLVQHVPSSEVLAHRIVWSFIFMLAILLAGSKWRAFREELAEIKKNHKKCLGVITASLLITVNWFIYIWAVNSDRIIETSLGYYINPLVSVLLGILVLKERLSFWQTVSFFLALLGVLNMTFHFGAVPWVALTLAISFALYGLIKKVINVGAITGITVETMLISPFTLLYLIHLHLTGTGSFRFSSPGLAALLVGAGIVTALPLILFAKGANRLPLSILGFLQYLAPTIALLLGVLIYHESFTRVHLISFSFIWAALLIFSLSKTGPLVRLETLLPKRTVRKRTV